MKGLAPDNVLMSLNTGALASFYLFYGPEEFRIELILDEIKTKLIPESAKDFNLETLYAEDVPAREVINRARLIPFMSPRRLLIVRGTEHYSKGDRELFLAYLDDPVDSTCIIWVSRVTELKGPFYKRFQDSGRAVNFKKLTERQAYGWMHKRAEELGVHIDREAAAFLYQMVGSSLRDIYSELWKLSVRFPQSRIGVEQIKDLATFSRLFTVFELVDHLSHRDVSHALEVLNRLFETQGRDSKSVLGVLGMVARQIRLISQAKAGKREARGKRAVVERLKPLPNFVIDKCIAQEKLWAEKELEYALTHLYDADGLIRTGSKGDLILENLVVRLCRPLS
ncbi:MAG: DNA polymerase III subunit delta [Deltaproteobacteria bacterium]|nr:DNA polymerase III subunit delta [Deltaproteobacteria bacterium]MBW2076561.1 DNA polymerase III subunit delta [Deltaproteobacteria bacterium]MBW2310187.1 DNA polymerase III subunit delta [Deltaproteobacteria bacterium]RLB31902.1 MAG: DNA polymerase III subunit delta [Deltaproteobacteria bacterium]